MPFDRPTLSDLIARSRADMETRLPGADSALRHSVLDVLVRTIAGAHSGIYGFQDYLSRQILPDTADAEHLARWATIWGVQRKSATPARGEIEIFGDTGATVPEGAELTRQDGQVYRTIAAETILAASKIIAVEAAESGSDASLTEGTVLTFSSANAGVQSDAAVSGDNLVGGTDEEEDGALLARLLQRVREAPQGGAATDYKRWALEVPGVTRAWVYPSWTGPGTVGVTFVIDGREDILPVQDDLDAVQAHLDELRPVTAELVLFAPVALPVDLRIRLTPDTDPVKEAVEAELRDMFARDSQPGGTIYISRISEAISLAQGEERHVLDLPNNDIVAEPGFMPFLGDITWI